MAVPASAFGLKTHLWIGQSLLVDISDDCEVRLAGVDTRIDEPLCNAIKNNPGAFLAGNLGPDAYPDLITGQVTTHPGIEGGWQTHDWLQYLLANANSEEELAFAAGYLMHAASDAFAHTYVNAYAGDTFELADERAVERRHFALEKYIDSILPSGVPDPELMTVPTSFLRDKLVHSRDAGREARRSGIALHISAMSEVWFGVVELERQLEKVEGLAARGIADLAVELIDVQAKIATGETSLSAAEAALDIREARLRVEKQAYDSAKKALDDAIDAVEENDLLVVTSNARIEAADRAIDAAQSALNSFTREQANLESRLNDLKRRIRDVPRRVTNEICHGACRLSCNGIPFSRERRRCRNSCYRGCEGVNGAWRRLNNEISRVENSLTNLKRRIQTETTNIAAEQAKRANALEGKILGEAQAAGLSATRSAAQLAFEPVRLRYEAELALTEDARELVENIQTELASLREDFLDKDRLREKIQELVDGSNIISGFANNWRNTLEDSGDAYIEVALQSSIGIVSGEGGTLGRYRDWLKCHGSAYTPQPLQVSAKICEAETFYNEVRSEIDQIVIDALPEPFRSIYDEYLGLRILIREELESVVDDATVELIKLGSPDGTTEDFLELLFVEQNVDRSTLNRIFAEVGDSGGKDLLTFSDMAANVQADAFVEAGVLDPSRFPAIRHGRTLSALALLSPSELRRLAWRLGANPNELELPSETQERYTILSDMLRSIDGNHQWQRFGLPYARSNGQAVPDDASRREFGRANGGAGFPFFANPNMRRFVFSRLFPDGISGTLKDRPELQHPRYAFQECDSNRFPRSTGDDSAPAESDLACVDATTRERGASGITIFWRRILDGLGIKPRSTR
ncbi:zinc dependent phospholipase C family protein [Alteraurantiacibacter aquimixticola]|nr:zinc dependent phospholipase C family protein [Alteraurantiacibacter aquimixticola]